MHPIQINNKTPISRSSSKVSLCCAVCGLVFERYAAWAKKAAVHYCGRGCASEGRKIVVECICAVCGVAYQSNPSKSTRVVTCSRRCFRLKKIRDPDNLLDRLEAIQARDEIAADATHCAKCKGMFGEETRCVEGLIATLSDDSVTVIVDTSSARVVCRPCHMEKTGKIAVRKRKYRPMRNPESE